MTKSGSTGLYKSVIINQPEIQVFDFVREIRSKRTIAKLCRKIIADGLPSAFEQNTFVAYICALSQAQHTYKQLFFGKARYLHNSEAGRPNRDKILFRTLVAVMFSSFAPYVGIENRQTDIALRWQLDSIPKEWHEHLAGLTEALEEEAGDLSFQSNSILMFMKEISNAQFKFGDSLDLVSGELFSLAFTMLLSDFQDDINFIKSELPR